MPAATKPRLISWVFPGPDMCAAELGEVVLDALDAIQVSVWAAAKKNRTYPSTNAVYVAPAKLVTLPAPLVASVMACPPSDVTTVARLPPIAGEEFE